MLSDTLSDAVNEIDLYLSDNSYTGEIRDRALKIRDDMNKLRLELDMPPDIDTLKIARGTVQSVERRKAEINDNIFSILKFMYDVQDNLESTATEFLIPRYYYLGCLNAWVDYIKSVYLRDGIPTHIDEFIRELAKNK